MTESLFREVADGLAGRAEGPGELSVAAWRGPRAVVVKDGSLRFTLTVYRIGEYGLELAEIQRLRLTPKGKWYPVSRPVLVSPRPWAVLAVLGAM